MSECKSGEYDLFEHRHRFAAWAAGRAAQRRLSKASVPVLGRALAGCDIFAFVRDQAGDPIDQGRFDGLHRQWCRDLRSLLIQAGVVEATYGRAAKLVAVYLKCMVVCGPSSDSDLARVAHPPIDRILLQALSRCPQVRCPRKRAWRCLNWTELAEPAYWELIADLRNELAPGDPFWMIEQFWKPI